MYLVYRSYSFQFSISSFLFLTLSGSEPKFFSSFSSLVSNITCLTTAEGSYSGEPILRTLCKESFSSKPSMPPFVIRRVTISSIAAFEGAHTMIFLPSWMLRASREMIPLIVWVLPVPGGPWMSKTWELLIFVIYLRALSWLSLYLLLYINKKFSIISWELVCDLTYFWESSELIFEGSKITSEKGQNSTLFIVLNSLTRVDMLSKK